MKLELKLKLKLELELKLKLKLKGRIELAQTACQQTALARRLLL